MSAILCIRRLLCVAFVSLHALLAVIISQRMRDCDRIPTLAAVALVVVVAHGLNATLQCLWGERLVARQFPPYCEQLLASTLALVLWVTAIWSAAAVASHPECIGGCDDCSPVVFTVAFVHAVIMGTACVMCAVVVAYAAARARKQREPPIPDRLDVVMTADVM